MSPKPKSAGKKAAQTKKRSAAANKAAATRKHRAAGKKAAQTQKRSTAAKKAAAQFDHHEAGKKAAKTRMEQKPPQSVVAPSAPMPSHMPSAIERTEELPKATPDTFATVPETSEPGSDPTASLKTSMKALRQARWGKR